MLHSGNLFDKKLRNHQAGKEVEMDAKLWTSTHICNADKMVVKNWEISIDKILPALGNLLVRIYFKLNFIQYFFFLTTKFFELESHFTRSLIFIHCSALVFVFFLARSRFIPFGNHYQFSYLVQLFPLHIKWKFCFYHVVFFATIQPIQPKPPSRSTHFHKQKAAYTILLLVISLYKCPYILLYSTFTAFIRTICNLIMHIRWC